MGRQKKSRVSLLLFWIYSGLHPWEAYTMKGYYLICNILVFQYIGVGVGAGLPPYEACMMGY
jgi:hypothetical protein